MDERRWKSVDALLGSEVENVERSTIFSPNPFAGHIGRFGVVGGGKGEHTTQSPRLSKEKVIELLSEVRGVGVKLAEKLYSEGIRSIEAIVASTSPHVSDGVRLCAQYHSDLLQDVTIDTAKQFLAWLEASIIFDGLFTPKLSKSTSVTSASLTPTQSRRKVTSDQPDQPDRPFALSRMIYDILLVGAHRRGNASTHDIDALIIFDSSPLIIRDSGEAGSSTSDSQIESSSRSVVEEMLAKLSKDKSFVGVVTQGSMKFTILFRINEVVTMIDFYVTPIAERGSALLHTTGPLEFNVILRKRARKMNFMLSEHGLFHIVSPSDKRVRIHSLTEEGILRLLDLPFIPPRERGSHDTLALIANSLTSGD